MNTELTGALLLMNLRNMQVATDLLEQWEAETRFQQWCADTLFPQWVAHKVWEIGL